MAEETKQNTQPQPPAKRSFQDTFGYRASAPKLPEGTMRADPYAAGLSGVDPLYGQSVGDLNEHDRRQYEEWQARQAAETSRIAGEEARKAELEHSVFQSQQRSSMQDLSRKVKKPSLIFYLAWFYIALLADIWDIVEALLGWGGGLLLLVDAAIMILFIAISYLASGQVKKIGNKTELANQKLAHVEQRITAYRQRYAKAMRTLRKGGRGGRAVARMASRTVAKFRKNPLFRAITATIANFIPVLDLLPWQLYGAYTTYKDHKRAYEAFVAAQNSLSSAQAEETAEFSQSQVAMYEDIIAQGQEAVDTEEAG